MRDKGFIVWIVLIAALLAVLNLPEEVSSRVKAALRDAVAPLQSSIATASRLARERVQSIRGIGRLVAENEKMAAELAYLRNEVRNLKSLEAENAALREQLQFAERSARRLIACNVIGRDMTGWWQTLRLDKGSMHGVMANMSVVTTEGLVGKITDVSLRTSDVLLISDPACKVSAKILRTGSFGVVSGRGPFESSQGGCEMEFINKNATVQAGDEVVTSGLGGVFPPGLLVGYIDKVVVDRSGLFQSADVVPRADLGTIEYVFVVAEMDNPVNEYLQPMRGQEGEML